MADQNVKDLDSGLSLGYGDLTGTGSSYAPKVVTATSKAASATNAIVTSDGTALAANTSRKAWSIQNIDDAAVYVKMGAGASASDFNFVLKAGTAANDGLGGFFSDDIYTGIVTILAAAGSPRVIVSEL